MHDMSVSNTEDTPLVSVIIPTFNRAHVIGRAIESVLAQTISDIELLVVDDASEDNTDKIVSTYRDSRVRYLRCDRRGGAAKARNIGIEGSRGKFLSFMDSDDEWAGNKLQCDLELLQMGEGYVAASSGTIFINEKTGKIIGKPRPERLEVFITTVLRLECSTTIDLTVRKDVMVQSGGFDEHLPARQDWDIWIRITSLGLGIQDPEVTSIHYVKGRGQISSGLNRKREGTIMLFNKHKELFMSDYIAHRKILNLIGLMYILSGDMEARSFLRSSYDLTPLGIKKMKLVLALLLLRVPRGWGIRLMRRYYVLTHPDDYLLW